MEVDRTGAPILIGSKIRVERPEREWHGITIPAGKEFGFVVRTEDGVVSYRHLTKGGTKHARPGEVTTVVVTAKEREKLDTWREFEVGTSRDLRRRRITSKVTTRRTA